jgi:Ku protein
MSDHQPGSAAR